MQTTVFQKFADGQGKDKKKPLPAAARGVERE